LDVGEGHAPPRAVGGGAPGEVRPAPGGLAPRGEEAPEAARHGSGRVGAAAVDAAVDERPAQAEAVCVAEARRPFAAVGVGPAMELGAARAECELWVRV